MTRRTEQYGDEVGNGGIENVEHWRTFHVTHIGKLHNLLTMSFWTFSTYSIKQTFLSRVINVKLM